MLLLLLLHGCGEPAPAGSDSGSSDSGDAAPGCEAWATVGSGERDYEDLAPGEDVVMVHGPQGGWHMLGSLRASGMGQVVRIHFTITDTVSGEVVSDNNYRVAMVMEDDCVGWYPGMYGYLDVSALAVDDADTPPELLVDHPVVLRMEVEGEAGEDGTRPATAAEIQVTAVPDPRDVESDDTGGSDDSSSDDSSSDDDSSDDDDTGDGDSDGDTGDGDSGGDRDDDPDQGRQRRSLR